MSSITDFLDREFKHFNARETRDAARGWQQLLDDGGQMFLAMAGAMSSAELGISLAEMIRAGKVHAICCTAANLEEDMFNLFAHPDYEMVPHYRDLNPDQETELRNRGFNRVTDTCIPEDVMRETEQIMIEMWKDCAANGRSRFPYEYVYDLLDQPGVSDDFRIPAEHSWVLAAKEMGIAIYTPGWEDSTWGNMFCAKVMSGEISSHQAIRTGTEQLQHLAEWYRARSAAGTRVGFFRSGVALPVIFRSVSYPC